MAKIRFEWDSLKEYENIQKHGVNFGTAKTAFFDSLRLVDEDLAHSSDEKRYFCYGMVEGSILTVRFTYRGGTVRIFGAGYWRKGRREYEKENKIH